MNYTKPEVSVLAEAVVAIQTPLSKAVSVPDNPSSLAGPGPAYEADE